MMGGWDGPSEGRCGRADVSKERIPKEAILPNPWALARVVSIAFWASGSCSRGSWLVVRGCSPCAACQEEESTEVTVSCPLLSRLL